MKVEGEGKYLELAECVMRRRMSAKARGDGREKTVQGVAEQETLPFPQKERENARKWGGLEEKSTSFLQCVLMNGKSETFSSKKRLHFETKDLPLPLIKHILPFSRRNAASI